MTLPPVSSSNTTISSPTGRLERWVHVLDDMFRLPGTRFRFGLDSLLGLLPGVGDLTGMLLGLPIVVTALRRKLPLTVKLMVLINALLDVVLGFVPLAGDIFDFAWKSHRKNLLLLQHPDQLPAIVREAGWKLSLLLAFLVSTFLALMVLLIFVGRWYLAMFALSL